MSATVPLEYETSSPNRYEFALESERAKWLHRRFLFFVGTTLAINLIFFVPTLLDALFGPIQPQQMLFLSIIAMETSIFVWAFVYALRRVRGEHNLYRVAFWLVVVLNVITMVSVRIFFEFAGPGVAGTVTTIGGTVEVRNTTPAAVQNMITGAIIGNVYGAVFLNHLFACLFLPWTVREATRPAMILVAVGGVILALDIAMGRGVLPNMIALLFLPASVLPGIGWCWWRYSRFRKSYRYVFESQQLRKIRKDLDGARRIHESSLPPVHNEGPIRFSYIYEPMSEIGGDLVFCREYTDPDTGRRTFTTVLLDVTGHGIAAALTVNRLVGELERTFAMNPAVGCDDIMSAVNSYAYYTLASHAIFVTGVANSISDCGNGAWELCFASAGHPTAFLRRQNGACETLESTTMMLGVLPPEVFDPASVTCDFAAGDALIIYTDGASEASRPEGGMMGIDGVQQLVERVGNDSQDPTHWPERMIRDVARWRNAPPDDDTLIAVLYRPLHADVEAVDEAGSADRQATPQYAEAM